MKRVVDIVVAAAGIIMLSPLLAVVALAVLLMDGVPVLYQQERIGLGFRPFRLHKFRTMKVGADTIGPRVTAHNDPRVTRLGRFLRHTKLDELPQLYNVLRGDMSLVGPRPEVGRYVQMFHDDYRDILHVRPGVTDLASMAFRHESELLHGNGNTEEIYVRSVLPEKIRLAKASIARGSYWHDLGLVLETLVLLFYPADLIERVFQLAARRRNAIAMVVQCGLAAIALVVALLVRFDGTPPANVARLVLETLPLLLLVRAAWLLAFGLHRDVWQYVGLPDLRRLVTAVLLGTISFGALVSMFPGTRGYPGSILVLDAMLYVAGLAALRIARRTHHELRGRTVRARRVLVVGVDDSADRVVRSLTGPASRVEGLVGADPAKTGLRIHDAQIIGTFEHLTEILHAREPDEILVVASAIPAELRKDVIHRCRAAGRPVRVLRDDKDLVGGNGHATSLDLPEADDFLFRDPIPIDLNATNGHFTGRRILVTGAGGTIGSEISDQIARCAPSRLVLFEKHEESLFHIERELRAAYEGLRIDAVIGDICDAERVNQVFGGARPEIVFHAAAYKHVPMMEKNPYEAIKTNVRGTATVAEAARRHGVESFVLISTDKAVEPVSVMGATKRLAELTIMETAAHSQTRFHIVRFGNVLDSSGSVIPIFRSQIERRLPITVTHPGVTRWFMTVPEAVHLILQAVTIGKGGEVFVLDMGKPVRILDLAHSLIRQYGLEPDRDIPIVITGLRPGERLFEKLFNDHETICKTVHPRILIATDRNGLGNGLGNGLANGKGNGEPDTQVQGHRVGERQRLMEMIESARSLADAGVAMPAAPRLSAR